MDSFSKTDVGMVRKVNQDYLFRSDKPVGNLPNLFLVADGMGGHKAGDLASRLCVETFVEEAGQNSLKTPVSILNEAVTKANETVFGKAKESLDYEGMGTTLVAATIVDQVLYVANIGDSRLYVIHHSIEQITEDHSWVEEMVKKGELSEEEMRFHPQKNIITRALGTGEQVTADFFEVELKPGDRVLMCSDGLSNMIDDDELFHIVSNKEKGLEDICNALVAKANEYGGKDNIAVVLIGI